MALFLISVLKKYLAQQDQIAVDKAYRKYCQYFLNPEIQENIRSIKELNKSDEFEWLDLFE